MKHKVLSDLSLAHSRVGFSGIPQDTRFLFHGLSYLKNIELTGLIFGLEQSNFNFRTDNEIEETAVFLGNYLSNQDVIYHKNKLIKIINLLSPKIAERISSRQSNKVSKFDLMNIPSDRFLDMLWRILFSKTLPASEKQLLQSQKYCWSKLSVIRAQNTAMPCQLDTRNFDFAIFQDCRQIKLSRNTQKIVRYHDATPLFNSDTTTTPFNICNHIGGVKSCEHDSVFVCNSTASLDELTEFSPIAAKRARVIPYFLPRMQKQDATYNIAKTICALRRSESSLPENVSIDIEQWFNKEQKIPKFIMSLATIEPRKNFMGLINAWAKLRYQTGEDVKLMIAGSPGWNVKPILKSMAPFVKMGDLMHLENVAQDELPYLYSAATCFVYPSFAEGFGLPPNEAMQCDCPVALSDIPAHRYSAGDAALYFDPYDIDDMAHQISRLLDTQNNAPLIDDLIHKGRINVKRYSHEALLPQWEQLFDDLKAEKTQR